MQCQCSMSGGVITSPEPLAGVGVLLCSHAPGKHNSGGPKDTVIASTMNQGRNVMNTINGFSVNMVLGNAHRSKSAVCWMLGIAGSTSTCKNPSVWKNR